VVDRVVDDVVEGLLVLLLRFDDLGPVAPPEDVILAPVALVECAGVAAVQVAHPLVEVRGRCLDDEVVVVAEQALCVHPPAVAAHDAAKQVEEDDAVVPVDDDRRVIVPARDDVVEGAVLERPQRASHPLKLPRGESLSRAPAPFGTRTARTSHVPGTGLGGRSHVPKGRGGAGYAATFERSRC
jgi:hypothetical protein